MRSAGVDTTEGVAPIRSGDRSYFCVSSMLQELHVKWNAGRVEKRSVGGGFFDGAAVGSARREAIVFWSEVEMLAQSGKASAVCHQGAEKAAGLAVPEFRWSACVVVGWHRMVPSVGEYVVGLINK
jgi:hypothetical protein